MGSEAEFAGLGFIVTEFEHDRIVELAVYDLEDPENRPETEETFQ